MGGAKNRLNRSKRVNTSNCSTHASPPSKGKGRNYGNGNHLSSASRFINSRNKGVTSSIKPQAPKKGSAFGYVYPTIDDQEGSLIDVGHNRDKSTNLSDPVLINSGSTQIFAYVDKAPLMEPQSVKYTSKYRTGLGSDDVSHRGLGFSEELETTTSVCKSYVNQELLEDFILNSPSFVEEMETDVTYDDELSEVDDLLAREPYVEKNSHYLSVSDMKLYTQNISCGKSDIEDDDELSDGESMESFESDEQSGSSNSDGLSDNDLSIDEEIAEDYFDGIGCSERVVNADLLLGKLCHVNGSDLCGGRYNDTQRKLGWMYVQDASRDHSTKKSLSQIRYSERPGTSGRNGYACLSALDDPMVVKDYRTISWRKKHGSRFAQSWTSNTLKNKHFRKIPGEKRKLHKETISRKRCERMIRRGVDLEQINLKLQKMVLGGVDVLSFQPMHSRDCSKVRRLVSIYCLQSGCQGSGKKSFVTVIRTAQIVAFVMISPQKQSLNMRCKTEDTQAGEDVCAGTVSGDIKLILITLKLLMCRTIETWNVGGKSPTSNLSVNNWLLASPPADIYVLGLQEIVPLNAGNILGAEDNGPAKKWLALINKTLNNRPGTSGSACCTPSPVPNPVAESNADFEGSNRHTASSLFHRRSFQAPRNWRNDNDNYPIPQPRLDRRYSVCDRVIFGHRPSDYDSNVRWGHRPSDYSSSHRSSDYSSSHRPSDYSSHRPSDYSSQRPSDYSSSQRPSDYSLGHRPSDYSWGQRPSDYSIWGSSDDDYGPGNSPSTVLFLPMEDGYRMPGHSRYCLVVTEQMVGVFLTIWVRSDLKEHVQNIEVSRVGRGLMGYLGNKGSISVSMLLHQTSFCFVCSHLTSGQKEGDELRRNSDVMQILRRTRFP